MEKARGRACPSPASVQLGARARVEPTPFVGPRPQPGRALSVRPSGLSRDREPSSAPDKSQPADRRDGGPGVRLPDSRYRRLSGRSDSRGRRCPMAQAPMAPSSSKGTRYYDEYTEYAKTLRTWFV